VVHAAAWVSQWLARNERFEAPGLVAAAVLIIGISWLAVISTGALMSSAQERLLAWESRVAEIRNLNYMQDRGTDWVIPCWVELEHGRELPDQMHVSYRQESEAGGVSTTNPRRRASAGLMLRNLHCNFSYQAPQFYCNPR
jgi:hypothetical protein